MKILLQRKFERNNLNIIFHFFFKTFLRKVEIHSRKKVKNSCGN